MWLRMRISWLSLEEPIVFPPVFGLVELLLGPRLCFVELLLVVHLIADAALALISKLDFVNDIFWDTSVKGSLLQAGEPLVGNALITGGESKLSHLDK